MMPEGGDVPAAAFSSAGMAWTREQGVGHHDTALPVPSRFTLGSLHRGHATCAGGQEIAGHKSAGDETPDDEIAALCVGI